MLEEVKTMLLERFKMKKMVVISRFLGIDFKVEDNTITMDQEVYIKKVLERFNMMNCKPKLLPNEPKIDIF